MYSGNTTLPTMRPRSDAFHDVICTHAGHCPCRSHPAHSCAPICSANWRHGNTPVHSQCGTSLMQVVQKSIAPKDNLHHTSVFPLTVLLDVSLSSPPATMVPVHDMKHAPKGSAQATIKILWGHSRICHLQQAWLDCPCELLKWTGLAPTVCQVPGQEWLTMQHYGHNGFIWSWGPRARH